MRRMASSQTSTYLCLSSGTVLGMTNASKRRSAPQIRIPSAQPCDPMYAPSPEANSVVWPSELGQSFKRLVALLRTDVVVLKGPDLASSRLYVSGRRGIRAVDCAR